MQSQSAHAKGVVRTENLDAYRTAVNSSFVPLQVDASENRPFSATLSAAAAGGVVFTQIDSASQQVQRTPESIKHGGSGFYKVSLLLSGSSILVQDGREVLMQPGDLTYYDTSRPYSLLFDDKFSNLIMMLPKDRLDFFPIVADTLTAVSLNKQHELAKTVVSLITQAHAQFPTLNSTTRTKLANTSVELFNTMLSAIFDVEAEPHNPQVLLLQEIYAYINAHLGSTALSPRTIAEAHYMSVRRLHTLFAELDTTVSTVIRQRRLEQARADLADPATTNHTIAAIAAKWGFVDAAHFSRVFKQTYGVTPREFRSR
ncbi:AraC-like ligand-binding domain-containing protein [Gulosibacter chungangensis]|uniref:Helix-turn-helix domain-containing protein n=1 Tax=Gulosibacter chungangensis TaxID=979746 RepID=A0A7J5BER9_9MICO|nr:helix-turn-helix domain-containing protein [Gulosibacter chungangensis]KAB1644756.1 helix-turn-helix domain-containing protein [Gulosibacter chungangensis]